MSEGTTTAPGGRSGTNLARSVTVALPALALAASILSSEALAGTTTGFTFDIPAGDTLTNVYVGTATSAGSSGPPLINDLLLPSGSTTINSEQNVSPPGFTVGGGNTVYNLSTLFGTTTGNNDFAVLALYKDGGGTNHVVIGTNLNLAGQPYPFDCPGGCTDATYGGWLTTGLLGMGSGTGIELSMFWGLLEQGGFAPLGSTVNLWEYSTGTQIAGASVTSNSFGVPVTSVPAWVQGLPALPFCEGDVLFQVRQEAGSLRMSRHRAAA
jgi:hypothetical protein